MTKTYTIKTLCELTSVSVRTLHYYDEINLLTPSYRASNGHRRYSGDDVARLQQIVTLKYMGFSLKQIKKSLQGTQFDIASSFKMQASALAEEAARIKKASHLLHYLMNQQELKNAIDWNVVMQIIGIFNLKDQDMTNWYKKYLDPVESQVFEKFSKKRTDQWVALFNEIKQNLDTDPDSKIAQRLIKKWHKLADAAYGDNPKLKAKLWEAYKAGLIPDMPYDKNVIRYLSKF